MFCIPTYTSDLDVFKYSRGIEVIVHVRLDGGGHPDLRFCAFHCRRAGVVVQPKLCVAPTRLLPKPALGDESYVMCAVMCDRSH